MSNIPAGCLSDKTLNCWSLVLSFYTEASKRSHPWGKCVTWVDSTLFLSHLINQPSIVARICLRGLHFPYLSIYLSIYLSTYLSTYEILFTKKNNPFNQNALKCHFLCQFQLYIYKYRKHSFVPKMYLKITKCLAILVIVKILHETVSSKTLTSCQSLS